MKWVLLLTISFSLNTWANTAEICNSQFLKAAPKLGTYTDALKVNFKSSEDNLNRAVLSNDTRALDEEVIRIDREDTFPQRNLRSAEKKDRYWVDNDYFTHNYFRREYYQKKPDESFQVARGKKKITTAAGIELLEHLALTLPKEYPQMFLRRGQKLYNKISKEVWDLSDQSQHPLAIAGQILNEDLVLMEEMPNGEFKMVGGFLVTPSGWNLDRHLGNSLRKIHEDEDPALVQMIEKSISHLKKTDQVSQRNGWQITRYPAYNQGPHEDWEYTSGRANQGNVGENIHLRSELQTISLLPNSGLMLFTIKVFQFPLRLAARSPERAQALLNGVRNNKKQGHYDFPNNRLVMNYLKQRAEAR